MSTGEAQNVSTGGALQSGHRHETSRSCLGCHTLLRDACDQGIPLRRKGRRHFYLSPPLRRELRAREVGAPQNAGVLASLLDTRKICDLKSFPIVSVID